MLKKLKNYSVLKKIIKQLDLKDILDIFLFGSAAAGKEKPRDIDICIIFRKRIDRELIKSLNEQFEKKELNVHVSFLTSDAFFTKKTHALAKTLLFEGISLITEKPFSKVYGLASWTLYTYDLSKLKKSKKVRFVYLLKGRGEEKGIVEQLDGKFIAPGSFIIPIAKDREIIEIFDSWKIKYTRKKIMLMD